MDTGIYFYPFGIAIFDSQIYLTDWVHYAVWYINVTERLFAWIGTRPFGIQIVDELNQPTGK